MGLSSFLRRRRKPERVVITESAVTRTRPDGVEESIQLGDLSEVGILTTDEGPWQEDVYFLLIGSDGKSGCVVPQSAEGCDKLLSYLQKLPGFNNEAVIKAMGSTTNAKFVCWKRQVS
jgi:hypothetical protein